MKPFKSCGTAQGGIWEIGKMGIPENMIAPL